MADKLQQILNLVNEYVTEREENKSWTPGEDWVSYSGPVFDHDEYMAAVEVLLSGWLIFGQNSTVLGIIPSFTIPILRGFESYAIDGWANLLFGGLCAGFVTGAFWRPRRKTWILNSDGEVSYLTD